MARKAETLSPLGALFYNTGRYEEALQIYREAAALQPSHRELRLALVSGQTEGHAAGSLHRHVVEGAAASRPPSCNWECYNMPIL